MSPALRRRLWGLRGAVLLLGLLLIADGLFRWIPFGIAVRLWLVALGGLAANAVIREAVGLYEPVLIPRPRWRGPRRAPAVRPAGLAEIERAVQFATWSGFDLRLRLAPLLTEIAAQRLAGRRGIDLKRQPEAARVTLGPVLWKLVEPAGSPPARHRAGSLAGEGLRPHEMAEIVATLEGL